MREHEITAVMARNVLRRPHDDTVSTAICPQGFAEAARRNPLRHLLTILRRIEDSRLGDLVGVLSIFAITWAFLTLSSVLQ